MGLFNNRSVEEEAENDVLYFVSVVSRDYCVVKENETKPKANNEKASKQTT